MEGKHRHHKKGRSKATPKVLRGKADKSIEESVKERFSPEERRAFTLHINLLLSDDADLAGDLPMDPNTDALFEVASKGVLLCKLIDRVKPGLIDKSKLELGANSVFKVLERHNMAIAAAKEMGCSITNVGAADLVDKQPHLILSLVWQILRVALVEGVNIEQHPTMARFLEESGDEIPTAASSSSSSSSSPSSAANSPSVARVARGEHNLLKWFNAILKQKGYDPISNLGEDIKDGTAYLILMNAMAPELCEFRDMFKENAEERAAAVVENASRLGCDQFVSTKEILSGNRKLNLAFTATLFHKHAQLEERKKHAATQPVAKVHDEDIQRLRQQVSKQEAFIKAKDEELQRLREMASVAKEQYALQERMQREHDALTQEKRRLEEELSRHEARLREREAQIKKREEEVTKMIALQKQREEEEQRRRKAEEEAQRSRSQEEEKRKFIEMRNQEEYEKSKRIESANRKEMMEFVKLNDEKKHHQKAREQKEKEESKLKAERKQYSAVIFITQKPEKYAQVEEHLLNQHRNPVFCGESKRVMRYLERGAQNVVFTELFSQDDQKHNLSVEIAISIVERFPEVTLICWNNKVSRELKLQKKCKKIGALPVKRGQTLWKLLGVKEAPLVSKAAPKPDQK